VDYVVIIEQQKQLLNFSPSPAKGRIASSTTAFRAKLAAPKKTDFMEIRHLDENDFEMLWCIGCVYFCLPVRQQKIFENKTMLNKTVKIRNFHIIFQTKQNFA
jgi:hypothetical protein